MKKEIWKTVKGYENLYEISSCGNVKSLNYRHTGREQVLRPGVDTWGYYLVCLCKDGKSKTLRVNRLVAIAFDLPIPEHLRHIPLEKLEVNHKNEIKTDNRLENLEWCTTKYNCNYGTRNNRIFEKTTNGKLSKPVLQIDKTTNEVLAEFPSMAEVHRQLGFDQSNICNCCLGKRKQAYGFIWKFA